MPMRRGVLFIFLLVTLLHTNAIAQRNRAQFSDFLSHAYFGLDVGYINYPFSNDQLKEGFTSESIKVPHTAVRLTLLGYRFNKYLSAEINYMRPVSWVRYEDINGAKWNLPVFMNLATIVLKPSLPLNKDFSLNGEAGFALVTRRGIEMDQNKLIEDATYASVSVGGGIGYHLNEKWELLVHASFSPSNNEEKQPATSFYSAGFKYKLRKLPEETVKRNSESGFIFPHQVLQIGYSTSQPGYGVNNFFSKKPLPIFWGGHVQVRRGVTLNYQRNIFHTRKVFSLEWGASVAYWKSNENGEEFYTASLYPLLRFTVIRTKPIDIYFNYSVAGPSYISKTTIDEVETGKKFTFQDFMGMGVYAGKNRKLNAEFKIAHYSNGNLFPQNDGVMIPLTFSLGFTF